MPVELHPLSLGVMPTMDGFPFIVAQKSGIYDSLGLKVNLVQFNSPYDRDAALLTGKIDGAITDYPSIALLQVHHPGVSVIMATQGYFCFITNRQNPINQFDELKEKNIAISRGTVIDYATDLLCEKYGIKSGEINKPEIAQIPLRLNMLQYGQIEATFLPDPFATIAMKNGNKSLISTRELNIHLTGTAFTEIALKEKRKEITALIKGYNLGIKHIQACSPKELNLLLTEAAGIPDYIAKLILLPSYTPAKRPDEQDIRQTIKWLRNKNKIPDNYQGENLVDTTFLPRTMNTSANRHAKR
ncbi:hypothetical protein HMPREF1532_02521 [Bacteroides salyersiae WAL 10018 = DSM 18765 = JCM 12988]|nr:hypothetical protein HMPREF1532_02521 [Bacteroides salyersiae WAL 10018 = DSM 18765 = JCM 12988]